MDRRSFMGAAALGLGGVACGRGRGETPRGFDTSGTDPVPRGASSSSLPPEASPWSAADFATVDSFVLSTNGDALRIVEAGTVVHEWYRDGDPSFARDIYSAQKSVLSLLVGIAVDQRIISIDTEVDSVLGDKWSTGDTSTITISHLLAMTSGLNDALQVIDRPGNTWRYNNAFAVLFDVIETITGRTINDVATDWLFDPIGASGATFRPRPNTVAGAAYGLVCTAAQLCTIGTVVLGGGPQPVSRQWLDDSFVSSQAFNPGYGRLWWLNGQSSYMVPEGLAFDGPLIPRAPTDLVAALGKDDQKLYVSPSLDLVVVRLGSKAQSDTRLALSSFDDELWTTLINERDRTGR